MTGFTASNTFYLIKQAASPRKTCASSYYFDSVFKASS
jgi:hypothetical protein